MKKIYAIIVAMLLFAGAYAQTGNTVVLKNGTTVKKLISNPIHHFINQEKTPGTPFWIDYDTADAYNQAQTGNAYTRYYGWRANGNFSQADTVMHLGDLYKYMIVRFDSLVDYTVITGTSNTVYPYSQYPTIYIDSLSSALSQMNTSGFDDTLMIQVMSVDANGYPSSTVYWSNTMVIPAASSLSGSNDWNNVVGISWQVNQALPTNVHKFCVKLTYLGAKADTFGYVDGFPSFLGTGGCAGYNMANQTSYYPNTYVWVAGANVNAQYPTSTGGDVFYDCNGDGTYEAGIDGTNYMQNGSIQAKVDVYLGIEENKSLGIKLMQNMPNPFNNTTNISYQLAKRSSSVTLEISDLAGRTITTIDEGAKNPGYYMINLDSKSFSQGVYFYTLNVDGVRLTNRMMVTK
jgi:hypothetical protein